MFTFANPFLFWALPVLLLPWIFRRRQEERVQKIEFPLIQFLLESEEKDLINPRLQELLLLILRTILLLLLLLALAGPKWNANGSLSQRLLSFLPLGASVQSSVVVVDSSYSMAYGQGESSWWNRASRTADQINNEMAGFNTSWLWLNQDTMNAMRAGQFNRLNYTDINAAFETTPNKFGVSIPEFVSVVQSQWDDQERFILITDGQRNPWEPLLGTTGTANTLPPLLVVTVGDDMASNVWLELSEYTSPPWGIAVAESISGVVKSVNSNLSTTVSVYEKESAKSLFSQKLTFSDANEGVTSSPFQINVDSAGFMDEENNNDENSSANLIMELDHQDQLVIDNQLELSIPLINSLQVGVAYDSSMQPVELRFISAALLESNEIIPLTPSPVTYTDNVNIAILSGSFVPIWSPTDTMNTLEYIKNGGQVLLFTGSNNTNSSAWNSLLEELGWSWDTNTEGPNNFLNVSVAQGDGLSSSLQEWNLNMWDTWIPSTHGKQDEQNSRPVVVYQSNGTEYHLITESTVGLGKLWIVNANIQANEDVVWSPILPSIIWGSTKESAKAKASFEDVEHPPRWESDLTILSEEDKELLTETYGIKFVDANDVAGELQTIYGGLDLRYLLMILTIFTALLESWLSNRLASL